MTNTKVIIERVRKLYPNSVGHCIAQSYKEGEGWSRNHGVNLPLLTASNLSVLQIKGFSKVCIYLHTEFGNTVYTDYSINELLCVE